MPTQTSRGRNITKSCCGPAARNNTPGGPVRITVTSGDKQVHIRVKGHSRAKLQAAEQAARRLLTDTPDTEGDDRPFGFTADT